jgi:hypothetical protein
LKCRIDKGLNKTGEAQEITDSSNARARRAHPLCIHSFIHISFIARKEIFFLITYFAFTEFRDEISTSQSVRTSFLVLTVCGLETA